MIYSENRLPLFGIMLQACGDRVGAGKGRAIGFPAEQL